MAYNSITKVKKVKKLISEIIVNRWNDTKIEDVGDSLVYDIQHKFEKVSYSVTFEIKDEVMNIDFRSKPYEKDILSVDIDYAETLRFEFLQNNRRGIAGISMEFEESQDTYAVTSVIPVICFRYWICLDIEDDTLEETMKTLLEVIVPNDCIQLIKFLRSNPIYLA